MRYKRLNHAAQNLCQMFCGWRLHWTKPRLVSLGSGSIQIDVLTGQCIFNGLPIPQLPIAAELVTWLEDDLAANQIPRHAVTTALLDAQLELSVIAWNERSTKEQFFDSHGEIRTPTLHRCEISCRGEIVADDGIHVGTFLDREEWPPNWPAA